MLRRTRVILAKHLSQPLSSRAIMLCSQDVLEASQVALTLVEETHWCVPKTPAIEFKPPDVAFIQQKNVQRSGWLRDHE
jgi:hypothetical protein